MLFREKLLELRTAAGLTQKTAADKAGMSLMTYRNYEQGTRLPGLPTFMKLIQALNVPCEVFAECEDVVADGPGQKAPSRPRGRPPKAARSTPPAKAKRPGRKRDRT
jgi:transcriptional regulator with XRE-family HTH domain